MSVLERYENLYSSLSNLPCENMIRESGNDSKKDAISLAVNEKLERRHMSNLKILEANKWNWEDLFYRSLFASFGSHLNRKAMIELSKRIEPRIIYRNSESLIRLEALLFGQSGLLTSGSIDSYHDRLNREYAFIRAKYKLEPMSPIYWKFMRVRPGNFPTIRLAQLAMLIYKQAYSLKNLVNQTDLKWMNKAISVTASEYWTHHYKFGERGPSKPKSIGAEARKGILINGFVPFLYSYGRCRGDDNLVSRALQFLKEIPAEKNSIVRKWKNLGIECKSAYMSQGVLELNKSFCLRKKCLICPIGQDILGRNS